MLLFFIFSPSSAAHSLYPSHCLLQLQQSAEPKILETYSKLTMKDAMDFMQRNPSTIGQMSGTESMSALFRNYTAGGGRLAPPFLMMNTW